MSDKHLEKWRQEFIELSKTKFDVSSFNGEFLSEFTQYLWVGFLYAKRNQTPIKIHTYDLHHYSPVRDITVQLRELGIKYEITGL
jgi:hypothetical protein